MKKILFCLTLFISISVFGEDLFFLNIKGEIKSSSGVPFKTGDKISTKDKVIFGSEDASAMVISSSRGRLLLSKKSSNSQSELEFLVSSVVSPANGKLSTRSGAVLNKIDVKTLIEKESFLILDTTLIKIPRSVYKQDQEHFFYLKYHYKSEMINKKLSFNGENLIVTPAIFTVDNLSINSEEVTDINLYYYDASVKSSMKIGKFNPIVISNTSLKKELDILKSHSKIKKKAKLDEEMFIHLNNSYGYLSQTNFQILTKKK